MMWTSLPSPSPLPKVASAPVSPAKATAGWAPATQQAANPAANPSAEAQTRQRNAETHGGFARALQRAAAHDSADQNKPPEPSHTQAAPTDGAAQGTPLRLDSAAKAAQSRAAAARLERGQAAAAPPPASQRQGHSPAPDEAATSAAPATSPNPDETPNDAATPPEAGPVGALLGQLRAAAAATTDPAQRADRAAASLAAAQTASARAGRATNATTGTTTSVNAEGPAAHRTAMLALGEAPSLAAGPGQPGDGSWAAASAAASSALQASSAEHAGAAVLAANLQPGPDAQPLLSSALAGAHLGLHSAPPAGSPPGATATAGEAHLSAALGSPDFGPQLGAQITTFVRDGLEHARLQLNPANMGPVLVQIQLDGQTAQVHLSAEHAWTRQALEDAMPQLASQLREAGLTLSGGGVSEQAQQGRQAPSPTPPDQAPSAEPTEAAVQQPRAAAVRRGVVDLVA